MRQGKCKHGSKTILINAIVQRYLDQGKEIAEIAGLMDLLADTLHKAV